MYEGKDLVERLKEAALNASPLGARLASAEAASLLQSQEAEIARLREGLREVVAVFSIAHRLDGLDPNDSTSIRNARSLLREATVGPTFTFSPELKREALSLIEAPGEPMTLEEVDAMRAAHREATVGERVFAGGIDRPATDLGQPESREATADAALAAKRLAHVATAIWASQFDEALPSPGTVEHALAMQMAVAATEALAQAMEMTSSAEAS